MRAPLDVCARLLRWRAVSARPGSSSGDVNLEAGRRSVTVKFADVTPNLIVSDIDRSLAFYRDVLGFSVVTSVPDAAPFAFVWMQRDGVSVFLNTVASVKDEQPGIAAQTIGGTATMFMIIEAETAALGVDALFEQVKSAARVIMPLKTQFYGMREFGIEDPDGYVIYAAQRVAG
jgi:uncharacterized glyoxalase superfamily protein PhnB